RVHAPPPGDALVRDEERPRDSELGRELAEPRDRSRSVDDPRRHLDAANGLHLNAHARSPCSFVYVGPSRLSRRAPLAGSRAATFVPIGISSARAVGTSAVSSPPATESLSRVTDPRNVCDSTSAGSDPSAAAPFPSPCSSID